MNKPLKCEIPEGKSGNWEVKRFEVTESESQFGAIRMFNPNSMGRGLCPPGTYTKLTHNNALIMSDTPDEMRDFRFFTSSAVGSVLVNGLGLGMTVEALCRNEKVTKVFVIEISPDVCKLVSPTLHDKWGERLKIITDDAFSWKPFGLRFNRIWHDIWPDICGDNLPEMKKLHRRYGHWLAPGGFQQSWCRAELERRL